MQNTAITDAYRSATKRLFLLDYDGTLMDIMPTPPEAAPTAELLQLLEGLASDPANTVVIVSGRKRDELDEWLGDLPLAFAAEHGFWRQLPGQPWETALTLDMQWQDAPQQRIAAAVAQVPGSLFEQKHSGLVWHYRTALDQTHAATVAEQLAIDLEALAASSSTPFKVIRGSKIIEVQLIGADKGSAAQFWLQQPGWDFVLMAGDDNTDEDMLVTAPAGAFTIRINGDDTTHANTRLTDAAAMRALLTQLAA